MKIIQRFNRVRGLILLIGILSIINPYLGYSISGMFPNPSIGSGTRHMAEILEALRY